MAIEFRFPDVGEGITKGEIVKWLVKEGDKIKEHQEIVQIETDKAVVDIPAPASGKILKINFKEGDSIKVGEILAVIGKEGEKITEKIKAEKEAKKVKTGAVVGEIEDKEVELGYLHHELEQLKGKSIKKEIVEQKIAVKKKYDDYGYIKRISLKGIRKTIAEHMKESVRETAQVTNMDDINITKLWELRENEKNKWKKSVKLTFLPFIVKAVVLALKKNPIVNSSLEGDEIIIKKYYNMGIAVETESGLVVPVIKIAENKSIIQIAKEIQELAEKARTRKIDLMDLKGGTFTITNYGSVGGTYGVPIINYPEAAILGVGRIFDKVVLSDDKKLKNVKILPVSLTFDHRILDGGQAVRFLASLKKYLEEPKDLIRGMK